MMPSTSSPPPDRRILTFPAVTPCPSASHATLLRSLAALAAEIVALRASRRFPVLRRGVLEAFREVAVLLAFFDDVRGRGSSRLPVSAAVGMSELHVALQRFRHLLSDCGRRGARFWVLMNSDRVAAELRALIRAVSTALDVLPLDEIDAGDEMKEVIRLLAKQSWVVEIGLDREDDRAVRAVRSMLSQFRAGLSPDPEDLRRVLHRLEVKSWADCNEEIIFLEEEMLENSDGAAGREAAAALRGSLIGFLIYCRAVLFDLIDADTNCMKSDRRRGGSQSRDGGLDFLNAENLRCPISLEVMTDPVTILTGQTYDRASINRWFKDGLSTCPVTGEKLKETSIVPNLALHKLIRDYCLLKSIPFAGPSGNKRRDLAKTASAWSSAAAEATRMTAVFLAGKLSAGTKEEKNRAAYEIRLLAKSSLFHRFCLVEADCVPWLLHLLSSSDASTQDNAVAALLNLSKHPAGRTAIFEVGGTSHVVDVMNDGLRPEVQQNAAAILFYLASVDEYRREIGEIPEAISALVSLLKRGTYRGKKNAVVALFGLLFHPGNHPKILATGVIPVLSDLLTDEREDLVNDCVGVLAKLAETRHGTKAILRSSSSVLPRLGQVLQSSTSRSGREYSVSLMLALCSNGGREVVGRLESLPLLMPALYSIVVEGPPQVSKKARSLIHHIHQVCDEEQQDHPVAAPATLAQPVQDRVVHAL